MKIIVIGLGGVGSILSDLVHRTMGKQDLLYLIDGDKFEEKNRERQRYTKGFKANVLAKKLKGFVGYKLFKLMPWLKRLHFWGSGFWNPAYDIREVGDINVYLRYLDKQKYAVKGQKTLISF